MLSLLKILLIIVLMIKKLNTLSLEEISQSIPFIIRFKEEYSFDEVYDRFAIRIIYKSKPKMKNL